jgi:phospholipid transport system substrate-binding protein
MARLIASLAFALFTALPCFATAAPAGNDPPSIVQRFCDTLEATMREGPQLGFDGRSRALAPAIDEAFAFPTMAKLALGPPAENLSPEQLARLAVTVVSAGCSAA